MHSSVFFKLFPPPRYMVMRHSGLHITDDAIRCLEFVSHGGEISIGTHAEMELVRGVIDGGDIKDQKALATALKEFDKKHDLTYVKVSVPEEKSYLFQTDVPTADLHAIAQNIEFKLEENVPLSAADAVFYFDLLPAVSGSSLRASVSVVPRVYIENLISLLRGAGMQPVAFEVLPKAIARAVIPPQQEGAAMIVYIMNQKSGIYIVSRGVVCFTSTITWGAKTGGNGQDAPDVSALTKEISRIYTYWLSHSTVPAPVSKIILVGSAAPQFEETVRSTLSDSKIPVEIADVWHNVFDISKYVPPITKEKSLDFAASAGLAMDS